MDWYSLRYPNINDLEAAALKLGVPIAYHYNFDVPRMFCHSTGEPWFIGIPSQFGNLARCWAAAHELGHLILHDGPAGMESWAIQEHEADAWAACALIPTARIEIHGRANFSGFMAALRKHYQAFGPKDSGLMRLAARISLTRLGCLEEAI